MSSLIWCRADQKPFKGYLLKLEKMAGDGPKQSVTYYVTHCLILLPLNCLPENI